MATDLGPAWIALLGGFFGAGAGYLGTRATLKASGAQAAEQRKHERALAAEERSAAENAARLSYQTETILETQQALHRVMRATFKVHHLDVVAHRTTGAGWRKNQIDPAWNLEATEASVVLRLLSTRLLDSKARDAVEEAHDACGAVELASSEAESASRLAAAGSAAERAGELLGAALRGLPAPTVYRPLITGPIPDADRLTGGPVG